MCIMPLTRPRKSIIKRCSVAGAVPAIREGAGTGRGERSKEGDRKEEVGKEGGGGRRSKINLVPGQELYCSSSTGSSDSNSGDSTRWFSSVPQQPTGHKTGLG